MPPIRAPPIGTDTLTSGRETTGVAILAATDEDMISTTDGRLVDMVCTTANALVVVGRNKGGTTKVPHLSPPRSEQS